MLTLVTIGLASIVLVTVLCRAGARVWNEAESSVTIRLDDRSYEYSRGMTPKRFAALIKKDFAQRPLVERPRDAVGS